MQQKWKSRLNLLASFAFLQRDAAFMQVVCETAPYINWLIDSGAFTNYQNRLKAAFGKKVNSAETVTIDAYVDACKKYFHGRVWQYIMLDVIRNAQQTERNLQVMLDAGLLPMPVYIESWSTPEQMQRLCAINKRICVAGGVASNDHYIWKRYKDAYAASGGQARIHALGFGRFPDVFQLPVSTYDSSSFTAGERFGALLRYSPREGFLHINWQQLGDKEDKRIAVQRRDFLRWLIDDCAIPVAALNDPSNYRKSANIQSLTQVFGYLQFSQHCFERGIDYFLAVSTRNWCSNIFGMLAHSNGTGFDYKETRARILSLIELQKTPDKWVTECVHIVKEYTAWAQAEHSQ